MKTPSCSSLFSVVFAFALVLTAQSVRAQGSPAGVAAAQAIEITGTITNASTKRALEGARVAQVGSDRAVFADQQGVYRLPLTLGTEAVLEVSYSGLDNAMITVRATAGSNRYDVKLTSAIYRLGDFVVAGEREGNAQAITNASLLA